MLYDHMKYMGRKVRVFLDGGWSCSGILEVFTTEEELVVNSPTGLISVPSNKVCAIQLSLDQPAVYHEQSFQPAPPPPPMPTQPPIAPDYPQGYDNDMRPPGVVPVPSGKPRRDTPLMERLKAASAGKDSGDNNHYGSILPNDMLLGDEPGEPELAMTFSPISPGGDDMRSETDRLPLVSEDE